MCWLIGYGLVQISRLLDELSGSEQIVSPEDHVEHLT